MEYKHFFIILLLFVAVRLALIISGVLPVLSSNSPVNILINIIFIAIIFYMGWSLAKLGLKTVAVKTVIVMFVCVIMLCFAVLAGYAIKRPVLGVSVPSVFYLITILISSAIFNILLGMFFAVAGYWVRQRVRR